MRKIKTNYTNKEGETTGNHLDINRIHRAGNHTVDLAARIAAAMPKCAKVNKTRTMSRKQFGGFRSTIITDSAFVPLLGHLCILAHRQSTWQFTRIYLLPSSQYKSLMIDKRAKKQLAGKSKHKVFDAVPSAICSF